MKTLAAFGCSFTEHTPFSYNNKSLNTDFDRWPIHLASYLNMKSENYGKCGFGNQQISNEAIQFIIENHKSIGFVAILWSSWSRFPFLNTGQLFPDVYTDYEVWGLDGVLLPSEHEMKKIDIVKELFLIYANHKHEYIQNIVRQNIINFYNVEIVCKKYNIPYAFMQGISSIQDSFFKHLKLNKNIFFEKILEFQELFDYKKFYGWIPDYKMGGYSWHELQTNSEYTYNECTISEKDRHPSALGHIMIANKFYEEMHLQ